MVRSQPRAGCNFFHSVIGHTPTLRRDRILNDVANSQIHMGYLQTPQAEDVTSAHRDPPKEGGTKSSAIKARFDTRNQMRDVTSAISGKLLTTNPAFPSPIPGTAYRMRTPAAGRTLFRHPVHLLISDGFLGRCDLSGPYATFRWDVTSAALRKLHRNEACVQVYKFYTWDVLLSTCKVQR